MSFNGLNRVIITNVSPVIGGGKYPARAILNKPFVISADIFCDGHDVIKAFASFRFPGEKKWREMQMEFCNNDHWEASVVPDNPGIYYFRFHAFIDPFASWRNAYLKKSSAGVDVAGELKIGSDILLGYSENATKTDKKKLEDISAGLISEDITHGEVLEIINDPKLEKLYCKYQN